MFEKVKLISVTCKVGCGNNSQYCYEKSNNKKRKNETAELSNKGGFRTMYDEKKKTILIDDLTEEVKYDAINVDFLSKRDVEILTKIGVPHSM